MNGLVWPDTPGPPPTAPPTQEGEEWKKEEEGRKTGESPPPTSPPPAAQIDAQSDTKANAKAPATQYVSDLDTDTDGETNGETNGDMDPSDLRAAEVERRFTRSASGARDYQLPPAEMTPADIAALSMDVDLSVNAASTSAATASVAKGITYTGTATTTAIQSVKEPLNVPVKPSRCKACTMPLDAKHDQSMCAKNPHRDDVMLVSKRWMGSDLSALDVRWMFGEYECCVLLCCVVATYSCRKRHVPTMYV